MARRNIIVGGLLEYGKCSNASYALIYRVLVIMKIINILFCVLSGIEIIAQISLWMEARPDCYLASKLEIFISFVPRSLISVRDSSSVSFKLISKPTIGGVFRAKNTDFYSKMTRLAYLRQSFCFAGLTD